MLALAAFIGVACLTGQHGRLRRLGVGAALGLPVDACIGALLVDD